MHDEYSVTDIYRILRERRGSVAVCMLLFGLAAVAWAMLSPPTYRASTTLLVGTGLNPLPEELASLDTNYAPLVLDHVAALSSTSLAVDVLEQLDLQNDPEFRPDGYSAGVSLDETGQSELVRNFRKKLTVSNTEESNVLEVRFETNNPEKSANIANTIAQAYLATQARFNSERSAELTNWLSRRTSQLQNVIFDIEMKLAAMRQLKDLPLVKNELQLREQEGLSEQTLSLHSEKAELQAKLALARRLGRTADSANIELEDTISSATLKSLVEQKVEAQRTIAELSTSYGPKHPLMAAAIAKRSQIASQLRQEASNIQQSLQNRLIVISGQEAELRSQVADLSDRTSTTYIENIELDRYESDLAAKKARLVSLLALRDSMAQREGLDTRSQTTRVVAPALVPHEPSSPSRPGLIGIALFTGLLFGTFWALIRELLDTRVTSPRKLLACSGRLPVGQIPVLKGLSKNISASARYLVEDADHEFAVSIRSAQWNFNLQHRNALSGTILITSALPREGKTTIATALARSLSLAEKSVLLIDANFNHPDAYRELGISPKRAGLSNLFTAKQQFYKLLRKDPMTSLHLLCTGPKPQDPAAMFAQDNLSRFLRFAEDKYDHVIVDSSAMSSGPESLLLSRHVSSTLLVVDAATTTRDHVADSIKSLESNNSAPTGVILNRVKRASQQLIFTQSAASDINKGQTQDSVISVSFPRESEEVPGSTLESSATAHQSGSLGNKSRRILEALIKIAEKEDRQVNINESNSVQR